MKKRLANEVQGDYYQKHIDIPEFKGHICYIKIKNIDIPLIVNNGKENICIKDNNYSWFELYPDNEKYALTIMFNDKNELIEWYFDIASSIGIEDGIPYEEDLYLDMIITTTGDELIIDENELLNAKNKGIISERQVKLAYQTLNILEKKYVNNINEVKRLTNIVCKEFNTGLVVR